MIYWENIIGVILLRSLSSA